MGNESEERNQRATALLVKSLSLLALVGSELSGSFQASPPRGYERWVQGAGSAFSMLLKLGAFSCGALVLLMLLLSFCTSQSVFTLRGWPWLTFRFWGSTLHFRAMLGLPPTPFLLSFGQLACWPRPGEDHKPLIPLMQPVVIQRRMMGFGL